MVKCVWGGGGFREGRCDVSSGLSQPGEKAVEQSGMGCVPCQGLPTKGDSRVLFTCEKGYVATPDT